MKITIKNTIGTGEILAERALPCEIVPLLERAQASGAAGISVHSPIWSGEVTSMKEAKACEREHTEARALIIERAKALCAAGMTLADAKAQAQWEIFN